MSQRDLSRSTVLVMRAVRATPRAVMALFRGASGFAILKTRHPKLSLLLFPLWFPIFLLLAALPILLRPITSRLDRWREAREWSRLALTPTGIQLLFHPYGDARAYSWPEVGQVRRVAGGGSHPFEVILNAGVVIMIHEIEDPTRVVETMRHRGMMVDEALSGPILELRVG